MRRLRSVGDFAYDFVVGDDWRGAAVIVAALIATALLVHLAHLNAWWLLPACVFVALGWSLRRATADRSLPGPPGSSPRRCAERRQPMAVTRRQTAVAVSTSAPSTSPVIPPSRRTTCQARASETSSPAASATGRIHSTGTAATAAAR